MNGRRNLTSTSPRSIKVPRIVAIFALSSLVIVSACVQRPIPLGVTVNAQEGLWLLLPEHAARMNRPYAPLTADARAAARQATVDLLSNAHWLETQGVQEIVVVRQRYCYPTGTTGYLQGGRLETAMARRLLAGCTESPPESLGRHGDTEFALVRFVCSPRSNGWEDVQERFEPLAAFSVKGSTITWVSLEVGDPPRMIPYDHNSKRKQCLPSERPTKQTYDSGPFQASDAQVTNGM